MRHPAAGRVLSGGVDVCLNRVRRTGIGPTVEKECYTLHRKGEWIMSKRFWMGLAVGMIMSVEEVSQIWFSSRTFDPGDLFANLLGVLVAELLVRAKAR